MTPFYVVLAVVAGCGLLWFLAEAGRVRAAPRLLPLFGLVGFWAVSLPFGILANSAAGPALMDRLDARTVEHALRLVATACLVAFVVATAAPRDERGTRRGTAGVWWWQAAALVAAVLALALSSASTPPDLRDRLAGMANGDVVSGRTGSTPVALFFLSENVYYLVAFAIVTVWVVRHLRRPGLPAALRRGLWLLLAGSVVLVAATAVLTSSVLLRWAGTEPPAALGATGLALLGAGLLGVVVGLAVPAVGSLVALVRIVRENRASARELEPLWTSLREAFPRETGPGGDPGPDRRRGAHYSAATEHAAGGRLVTWLSRRFYRTLIDCRDGLHQLGPYLQDVMRETPSDLPTGTQLVAALELRRTDTDEPAERSEGHPSGASAACHLGAPVVGRVGDAVGFDDDVDTLVLLSRRLAAARRPGGTAAETAATPGRPRENSG